MPPTPMSEMEKEFYDKFEEDIDCYERCYLSVLVDDIKSFIREQIQKAEQRKVLEIRQTMCEFFKEQYGYQGKYIPHDTTKKYHGTCCYCSTCGHPNDPDCVCDNNRIHKMIEGILLPTDSSSK